MLSKLYQIFYGKLPNSLEDVMPSYDKAKIVTCLNAFYLIKLKEEDYHWYEEFDHICSDGMGPVKLNKIFGKTKSTRLSFDMSSMAGPVFNDIREKGEGLYVLGAKPEEVENSVKTIEEHFAGIKIAGYHHGYIKNREDDFIQRIMDSGAKVVIIGMGAPMQDEMAVLLKRSGFIGTVYTCGGFIHQTQNKMVYYPKWIVKCGLRWVYRILKEEGMIKRLVETYPAFVVSYCWFLLTKCKKG